MTEPLKPRIDFSGPLEPGQNDALKMAKTFSGPQAEHFAPVLKEEELADEGQAEAAVEAACGLSAVSGAGWSPRG
jgi:putative membrane protein